mgnify:CR=1 FL=1
MFFKRKKLREIEEKIDVLQKLLERQAQEIREMVEHNRRLLCDVLHEKMLCMEEENHNMMGAVETKLKDMETNILSGIEESTEGIMQWRALQESKSKVLEETMDTVRNAIEQEQQLGKQLAEKLDLTENEIRMLLINSVLGQLPQDMEEKV